MIVFATIHDSIFLSDSDAYLKNVLFLILKVNDFNKPLGSNPVDMDLPILLSAR